MQSFPLAFQAFSDRVREARSAAYQKDSTTPRIEVDEAVRAIAGFYERTRNTLEYGEADFLRQRAIERSLRRMASFGITSGGNARALELLRELIRAGYLPNDTLPETIAWPVGEVIARFFSLNAVMDPFFRDDLLRYSAFSIEEIIFPRRAAEQAAIVAFALDVFEHRLRWPQGAVYDAAHRAFLFAATHRTVLNASADRILAAFLKDALSDLHMHVSADAQNLADDFVRALTIAKRTIAHPKTEQYARAMRRFAPAFRALDDAARAFAQEGVAPMGTLELERRIDEAVATRIAEAGKKMRTAAGRATLYVFFTKMVVGLAVEFPYDYFLLSGFSLRPFFINLLFPPMLMFLVAFSARSPKAATADRVTDDAVRIATRDDSLGHARLSRKRGFLRLTLFVGATLLLGLFAVFFIVRWLGVLGFSPVGMGVFLAFLSLVSVFAWRIRKPLREFSTSGGGGVIGTALEVFAFPFLALGRLLSNGLATFNIFLFLLDVFIEAPLKFLFAAGEDWIAFLREKREEFIEE